MDKRKIRLLTLAAVAAIALLFYFRHDEKGMAFSDEPALFEYQRNAGYEFLGKFDEKFPGVVTAVEYSRHSINFKLAGGAYHNYNNYDGYDLKVVRFATPAGEMVYVFRSRERR